MPRSPRTRDPSSSRWLSLAVTCAAVTVIVMDGSIVNVALPTLATSFGGVSNSRLQWVVDSYILSFAALLLTAGGASDRFGRRRMLVAGLVVFGLTSAGAALSGSVASLVAWRTLMGVGAAMIFPATLALVTESFPEPDLRRIAVACWAGSSGLGVAIGPVAGGWLLTRFAWNSIFLVNLPFVAIAAVGAIATVRESRDPKPPGLDPIGNLLAIFATVGLVWSLIEGPERGWLSAPILGGLSVSIAFLAAFVVFERRSPAPMLDLRLFGRRGFAAGCLAVSDAFFGLFGFVFMVTQYFQFVHGYGALESGVRTLPFAGFILLGAGLAARSGGIVPPRAVAAAGLALMAFAFGWVSRDVAGSPYGLLVAQMGVLGTGLGLVNAAATGAIMAAVPAGKEGIGSSVNDTTREIGGTLGVAVMGSVFNSLYRTEVSRLLDGSPLPAPAVAAIRDSVGAAAAVVAKVGEVAGAPAADALRTRVGEAFMRGFQASAVVACVATLAGAIGVLAFRRRPSAKVRPLPLGGGAA